MQHFLVPWCHGGAGALRLARSAEPRSLRSASLVPPPTCNTSSSLQVTAERVAHTPLRLARCDPPRSLRSASLASLHLARSAGPPRRNQRLCTTCCIAVTQHSKSHTGATTLRVRAVSIQMLGKDFVDHDCPPFPPKSSPLKKMLFF